MLILEKINPGGEVETVRQNEKVIKVLVVDDHPPFAQGLAALLEQQSDMKPVGVAGNAEQALKLVQEVTPDVVVMDISMPGMSGIEATKRIKEQFPEVVVLVLSAYGHQPYLLSALTAGAAGYLLKSVPLRELLNAIRSLRAGETVLDQSLASKLFRGLVKPSGPMTPGNRLEDEDLDLLKLGAKGISNKEIGEKLNLSERTVQSRFTAIFSKLGVASRMEAVLKALKEGWLSVDDLP